MRRIRVLLCLSTAAIMLAACSHNVPAARPTPASGPAPAAGPAPASGTAAADTGGNSPAANLGGGQLDVSKLCAAVPQADVQKLFKATAPAVTVNPLECDWGAGAITVDIYAGDPTKKYLTDLFGSSATPLSGIGDFAEWAQPVPGATVPNTGCHRGTTSITVTAGLNVDETTLSYTGSDPFYTIDPASAAGYATLEGALCTDMFNAGA
jgi:hypothetical protein